MKKLFILLNITMIFLVSSCNTDALNLEVEESNYAAPENVALENTFTSTTGNTKTTYTFYADNTYTYTKSDLVDETKNETVFGTYVVEDIPGDSTNKKITLTQKDLSGTTEKTEELKFNISASNLNMESITNPGTKIFLRRFVGKSDTPTTIFDTFSGSYEENDVLYIKKLTLTKEGNYTIIKSNAFDNTVIETEKGTFKRIELKLILTPENGTKYALNYVLRGDDFIIMYSSGKIKLTNKNFAPNTNVFKALEYISIDKENFKLKINEDLTYTYRNSATFLSTDTNESGTVEILNNHIVFNPSGGTKHYLKYINKEINKLSVYKNNVETVLSTTITRANPVKGIFKKIVSGGDNISITNNTDGTYLFTHTNLSNGTNISESGTYSTEAVVVSGKTTNYLLLRATNGNKYTYVYTTSSGAMNSITINGVKHTLTKQ